MPAIVAVFIIEDSYCIDVLLLMKVMTVNIIDDEYYSNKEF